jgi:hypothetical protein
MINPCKDCKDRHINCHAECEKYIQAKQEHEDKQAAIRKSKYDMYNTFALKAAHVRKRKKK